MQKKGYNFFNLPRECSIEDYKEAIDKIVGKYSKANGLVSIYSWGDVSAPGISDIDIVLVFGKNAEKLPFLSRSFYFLDSETRYLVRHPFVFTGEDSFKNARYVYPDTGFRLLFGKNINIRRLSQSEGYYYYQ